MMWLASVSNFFVNANNGRQCLLAQCSRKPIKWNIIGCPRTFLVVVVKWETKCRSICTVSEDIAVGGRTAHGTFLIWLICPPFRCEYIDMKTLLDQNLLGTPPYSDTLCSSSTKLIKSQARRKSAHPLFLTFLAEVFPNR